MSRVSAAGDEIRMRIATQNDLPSIVVLKQKLDSYHLNSFSGLWPPEGGGRRDFARYRQAFRQPTVRLFVAKPRVGDVAGYASASIQTRKCSDREFARVGVIGEFFVERSYRRRGVGSALVEAAARFFAGRRIKHITLRSVVENKVANQFWEGLSFKPVLYTSSTTLDELTKATRKKRRT